ncbi:Zinc finger CCHC-type [Arabidopsis suecica]|uniref:Zinc finger CCHC-type n=1 Tax=Arabidopsis suecica TaxID=45249 RepID=A0A8T2FF71_ARASU|nr:Zinc finger CCHC-type [Arabidopsis suecica]
MPKRIDINFGEDSVAIIDDDEEANEATSLKILEKGRDVGNKLDLDLSDSSVPILWKDQDEENVVEEDVVRGHITVDCLAPTTRRKPCFICASLEHGARQCTKGHDCYKYNSGFKGAVCLRCGDFGHDMILCKYEYSKEDLKNIQCYVCKSFGHLCCVEPDDSLSWAVSCYKCGQLGHTGLACGRHYDESNENDFFSPSWFKSKGEGHFKRDCPNSSDVRFLENCSEEGNSSSINTSQGRDSPSVCYKSKGAAHFARQCPKSNTSQDKLDILLTRNSHLLQCIDQLLSE